MTLSALRGEGVEELQAAVAARLTSGHHRFTVTLDAGDGAGAAWLHQHGEVLERRVAGDRVEYGVRMSRKDYERFLSR